MRFNCIVLLGVLAIIFVIQNAHTLSTQYLVCKAKHDSEDQEFKTRCERIQSQIILALTQLRNIFETIKVDTNPEMRKELADWIMYCGSFNKHAYEFSE